MSFIVSPKFRENLSEVSDEKITLLSKVHNILISSGVSLGAVDEIQIRSTNPEAGQQDTDKPH